MLKRPFLPTLFAVVLGVPLLAAMGGGGFGWIWAVLGISFLIAVHEWGHYMACVLTKTRTETFSIGFGPRLFGWERDRDGKRRFTVGTRQLDPDDHAMDFRIAAVPLGGYVKMAGGEIIGESTSTDPNEFVNKSASARIFIISAGVIMNVITAFLLYSLSFAAGKPVRQPIVGTVVPGGPAWRAGLEPGDRVIDISGTKPRSWLDVRMEIVLGTDGERIKLRVERGDETKDLELLPTYKEEGGYLEVQAGHAVKLTLGAGEDALTVGYSEAATVNGWPVRGGAEAHEAITTAFRNGADSVVVQTQVGASRTLSLDPDAGSDSRVVPSQKVGLEPFLRFSVNAMRAAVFEELGVGDALRLGDELRAIVSGGTRHDVDSPSTLEAARQLWPLESIAVFRAEEETLLPVPLATAVEVRRFFDALGLEAGKVTNRVRPLAGGHLFPTTDGIWRYPTSPASEAGILSGDEVLRVGDTETPKWPKVLQALQGAMGSGPVSLTVRSPGGNAERTLWLTPIDLAYAGDIQLTLTEKEPIQLDGGIPEAFALGFKSTGREIGNVFRTIGGLVRGDISFNQNIAGPITLIRASKQQAEAGPSSLLWFLAYISVMLAVLNILPIPVLDGGHLLFILIEKIKGSPLSEATAVRAMYVGLFLLLTLMFFAFKNDITRLF